MTKEESIKLAKKYIKKEPMPSSLELQFKKHGLQNLLEDVYLRTAELIEDNQNASKELMAHLEQILPCIAFYETILAKEGSQEKALASSGDYEGNA